MLDAAQTYFEEMNSVISSPIGGPFTPREKEYCNRFMEIVSFVDSVLLSTRNFLIKNEPDLPTPLIEGLSKGVRDLYFHFNEKLVPFVASLADHCRSEGQVFPALERFELSEKNIASRIDLYESGDDELEDLMWRRKAEEIALPNKRLFELAEKYPPPQDWYDEE